VRRLWWLLVAPVMGAAAMVRFLREWRAERQASRERWRVRVCPDCGDHHNPDPCIRIAADCDCCRSIFPRGRK
jgi:hypothetical protein